MPKRVLAVLLLLITAATAQAQEPEAVFDIPAQPLEQAMTAFQAQSGVRVEFEPGLLGGRTGAPVSGRLPVAEALRRLLAGTGLSVADGVGRPLAVVAAPDAPPAAEALPEVRVSGLMDQTAWSAWEPVSGYHAPRSLTGTKTNTPLIETPQSVSIVTRDQMADQQVETTMEALRYTAGVQSTAGRRGFEFFSVRGFDQSGYMFRDGTRVDPLLWISNEPYGLERVEVFKGAASVLYGEIGPGGLVNLVSKRPLLEPLYEAQVGYGSFADTRVAVDVGGPVDSARRWSYRLTGLFADREDQVDFVDARRIYVAPAVTWRPTPGTTLTLLTSYQDDNLVPVAPLPAAGTTLGNVNGPVPFHRFTGEPGFDTLEVRSLQVGWTFEQRLAEWLTLRQNGRYTDYDVTYRTIGGFLAEDQRTLEREAAEQDVDGQVLNIDTQMESRFTAGPTVHTVLAGVDYSRFRNNRSVRFGPIGSLDLYAPVYGGPVTFSDGFTSSLELDQVGMYLQDQVKLFDRLVVVGGFRHDETWGTDVFNDERSTSRQAADTGRVGILYLTPWGLAPYASWSTSFVPQAGTDFSGNTFDPTTGEQWEVGLKYEHPGGRVGATLSLYHLTQQNVLTDDLDHPGFTTQIGEQVNRGVELEVTGQLVTGLDVVAAYSYLDAEITKSNFGDEGKRPPATPAHTASLWTTYTLPWERFGSWRLGFGVRYVGEQPGDFLNTFNVPGVTLFDAGLYYVWGGWRVALTVKNLADKRYVAFCQGPDDCHRGDPRSVMATIQYTWR